MHGRLRALALMVGLSALPLQVSPTHAEGCELVASPGIFLVGSGSDTERGWRLTVDGVTYTSDKFDKFTREKKTTTSSNSSNKKKSKKAKKTETVIVFKDKSAITRTPHNESGRAISGSIGGEINPNDRSGFVKFKDNSNNKTYIIEDGSQGPSISC